ncbi:MAG TPA: Smr/MutS family protein [Syntrophorhabdaceae bacterium]|nr:Smr/MutS family protein [Syntrophorhabdaceae bacterium]
MKEDPINRPFVNLPELLAERKIGLKASPDPARVQAEANGADDTDILTEAMRGVKVIPSGKERITVKREPRHIQATDSHNSVNLLEEALSEGGNINVTNLPEYMEGFIDGTNPLTMEKLRGGEFSVEKTLDLHGASMDGAAEMFQVFMREAIREGLHCVKVIHGRGLKSKDAPVLRQSLKTWIIKAMHRKWILAFSNATMREGGPGATCILLHKRPAKKRIHIIG